MLLTDMRCPEAQIMSRGALSVSPINKEVGKEGPSESSGAMVCL